MKSLSDSNTKSLQDRYDLIQLIQKADEGDIDAMKAFINICFASESRDVFDAAQNKCFSYIRKLATEGDAVGYIRMADELIRGVNIKKDVGRALELYQMAVDAGETVGYEFMAYMYYYGTEIPVDYEKAYNLIMKSEFDCTESYFVLGEMYRLGLFLEKSMEKAVEYYQKIIDVGEYMPGSDIDWIFYCASERLKGNYEELKQEVDFDQEHIFGAR